ncbi:MAG TPA: ABC transporter permease [Gemmatimonadota bacterium]|nr:ABC transporter permease [Gemmatimonadota bacterium]
MSPRSGGPPAFWSGLVEWLLDPVDADAILGDLEEEYRADILPRRGPRAARRWYRRMVVDSIIRRWGRGRAARLRPLSPRSPNPGNSMDQLIQDLRYGFRSLWRRPSFTAAVVVSLGLAVGVNTAMFALVDGVLLEPLPYAEPDELVTLWQANRERPDAQGSVSVPNFDDWRERSETVEVMASYRSTGLSVFVGELPTVEPGAAVSDRFFEVFGARPISGRGIAHEEARSGGARAVVVSHEFWESRMGSDAGAVGSTLEIDGRGHAVVGIAPEGFSFPAGTRLWIGEVIDVERCGRGCANFAVVGRLAPGASPEIARSEFQSIATTMETEYSIDGYRVNVVTLEELTVGDVRPALYMLLGAVGLVLLIACANIANLLLTNARDRADEMALRSALGARRVRLTRQLLTESGILAAGGGLVGLALAMGGIRLVRGMPGLDVPRLDQIGVDATVLLYTLAVVAAAVVLFGLAPALVLARSSLVDRLRSSTRGSTGRTGGRSALVATQVALSAVLILGTALLVRTIAEVRSVPLGFGPEGLEIVGFSVPPSIDGEAAIRLHEAFREALATQPGIEAVVGGFGAPLSGINVFSSVGIGGWTAAEAPDAAGVRTVTPGYFETLGVALVRGRPPLPDDRVGSERVMWINETAAGRWFPGIDPIGRSVDLSASAGTVSEAEPRTVVGVVGDSRFDGPRRDVPLETYIAFAQSGVRYMQYFVRSGTEGAALPAARRVLADLEPSIPLRDFGSMERWVASTEAESRLWTLLLALFGLLALGLAALGIFGVVGYQVALRRREIGVRMAVGTHGWQVVSLMLRQGLGPAVAGVVAGLGLALLAVRLVRGLLFGVAPSDPAAWVVTSLVLLFVVVLASWIPATRAVRVDPALSLRAE